MGDIEFLPENLKQIHHSLEPYIRPRQDIIHIRRVLAAHVKSHVKSADDLLIPSQLPLVDAESDIEPWSSGVKGVRKEYLRYLQANIKAEREYASLKAGLQAGSEDQAQATTDSEASLDSFLDLLKQRRRNDRLRIIRDYVNLLATKPAAGADHVDPKKVLQDVGSFPQVPPEVMTIAPGSHRESEKTDLKYLVDQLEKSVLRAKMLLKKEQKLLAKLQAETVGTETKVSEGCRLQALGKTRNELINWIEAELGKAGETPIESEARQNIMNPEKRGKEFIDSQLKSIQRQYTHYIEIRKKIITAATKTLDPPVFAESEDSKALVEDDSVVTSKALGPIIYPYLEDLVSISNQQKSLLQLKSHVTSGFGKQLKESFQDLERLADESHLLPAYPIPTTSQLKGSEGPAAFTDEIGRYEKPDSSRRARAWVFAADSSSSATKEAILEKLEEGEVALENAHQVMLDFQNQLGVNVKDDRRSRKSTGELWSMLDGHLGVIKLED